MKTLIISLLILSSLHAGAACPEMVSKAVSSYSQPVALNSAAYKNFSKAMKHYKSMEGVEKAYLEDANAYIKGRKLTGYEVLITDGGDESTIRYVLDANKKIIVAYWYNQSPMTYWFCGQSTVVDEEETEDGSEI